MLLKDIFDRFDRVKLVFIRKNGEFKVVKRSISNDSSDDKKLDQTMFPISKDRK